MQVAAAYRITDASDAPGNNFTWTFSNSFFASVVNTVYSGVNTSIPIDVMEQSPSCNPGSAGSLIVVPAITTTVNNDLLVAIFAAAGTNNSVTLATGSPLSPVADQNNSGFGPADFNAFGMTYVLGSGAPGSYGPYTATQGASGEEPGRDDQRQAVAATYRRQPRKCYNFEDGAEDGPRGTGRRGLRPPDRTACR